MRNILLILAYDGTDFHGWQRQPGAATVQERVESAIQRITGERVVIYGSGRTDAGVHAAGQVANFSTDCAIPCANLIKALNGFLPPAIRIKEASEVPEKFHARYSARTKTYRYRILQAAFCSPFIGRFVWHYPYPLDRRCMANAAGSIVGEHDFTSFAGSAGEGPYGPSWTGKDQLDLSPPEHGKSVPLLEPEPEARSMIRTIFSSRILWRPRAQILVYETRGSGFLRHMVRNIVGTLVEVGQGKLAPQDILAILEARDRRRAGPTAPAQGLCLMKVEY